MPEIKSKVVAGVVWFSASKIVIQVYAFVVNIYVARILLPSDYGLMAIGLVVVNVVQLVSELGIGTVIVQKSDLVKEDLSSYFFLTVVIGAVLGMVVFGSSSLIEDFFEKPGASSLMMLLSVSLFINSLSVVPRSLIERKMEFKLRATIGLISKIVSLSAVGVLATFGFGVHALVYSNIIHAVMVTALAYRFEPYKPVFKVQAKAVKEIFSFACNIVALRCIWAVRGNIDQVIGGKYLNKNDFGYYTFVFRLVAPIKDVIKGSLGSISLPILASLQSEEGEFNRAYLNMVRYSALFSFPILIGGWMLSRELVLVLLSDKWNAAIAILEMVCLIELLRIMIATNEDVFIALGKPKYTVAFNTMAGVLQTTAFFIGIMGGVSGLLLAWVLSLPMIYIAGTYMVVKYRNINWSSYWLSIRPALFGAAMMMCVLFLSRGIFILDNEASKAAIFFDLLCLILGGAITYIITVHLTDKTLLRSMSGVIRGLNGYGKP